MYESMTVIMTYLLIVLSPVLIPATIHVVHVVRDRRPAFRQNRFAVPAAA